VAEALAQRFGAVDLVSPWMTFDFTDYYTKEMGQPLYRRILAFTDMIEQDDLPGIKMITNGLEAQWSKDGLRGVNIDPGYLVASRFVLASGKDFSHRIYIGQGIYADLTLIFTKEQFKPLPWTYPDYQSDPVQQFLLKVRKKYLYDIAVAFEKDREIE
jgi:hypothetical protein